MPSQASLPRFPKHLQFALTYAEESSKRVRWIVFLLQLAVVLVIYSVWQQHDLNWAQARLDRARAAIIMLTCHPEIAYGHRTNLTTNAALEELQTRFTANANDLKSLTREELDDAAFCKELDAEWQSKIDAIKAEKQSDDQKNAAIAAKSKQRDDDDKKTIEYLEGYNFSLVQAKANLMELRKLRNTRTLTVGVPILGIIFDVNDLSLIAAFTFAIILSWLHFSLRREEKNVKKVFRIAEDVGGLETLQVTYDLHAMTQVLTIPPGSDPDSRNMSPLRRWSRLPTFIIGTALIAEIIALADDFNTMIYGERLNIFVTHLETAMASNILIYIIYRTITCFRLNKRSYTKWVDIYSRLNREVRVKSRNSSSGVGRLANIRLVSVWVIAIGVVFKSFLIER